MQKRWVKRTVNIPKAARITNVSKAWDYAAKVFLRMRELAILFPFFEDDENRARLVYNQYNYGQHTLEEIKAFESTHLSTPAKNIKTKKIELTRNVRRTTERRNDEPDNYLKRPQWNTIPCKIAKELRPHKQDKCINVIRCYCMFDT